ncbi:MAG TPA: hypothetical protein VHT73_09865 [Thermodesulfobacteriota bacterium]|nr:hypothetical protein [Thermodesulfobacteriota bacterium]
MSEKIPAEQRDLQQEELDTCCGELSRTSQSKKPFTEPKLTFIEPKLTKHGDVTRVTAQNGFFGGFTPAPTDE